MGKIVQYATAGTLESSDAFVSVEPGSGRLEIDIDSVVLQQFGEEIRSVTEDVLKACEIEDAKVSIVDRGALECVIRARVESAILRGKGEA